MELPLSGYILFYGICCIPIILLLCSTFTVTAVLPEITNSNACGVRQVTKDRGELEEGVVAVWGLYILSRGGSSHSAPVDYHPPPTSPTFKELQARYCSTCLGAINGSNTPDFRLRGKFGAYSLVGGRYRS